MINRVTPSQLADLAMHIDKADPIDWNGLDDYGQKIGRGVYVYNLKVTTADGQTAEQLEKLVILN